jgi:putative membrane protein
VARFLDERAKVALSSAVRSVEARSSAEVVIAVRARSSDYRQADVAAGALVAYAALGFMLFSPWPFEVWWIFLDPLLAGVAGALLAAPFPAVRRAFTSAAARRRAVESAARASFVEKRVGETGERAGLLVYVSLLERTALVVADRGVRDAVEAQAWAQAVGGIDAAVARGETGEAVAGRIAALGEVLERALPRRAGDVNELSDEVSEA